MMTEHHSAMCMQEFHNTQYALSRPHVIMRPKVYPDAGQWCALYGENLQEGVGGFGDTPDKACEDFDKNWFSQKLKG